MNKGAGIDIGDKDGYTALHIASFGDRLDIVKVLVSKGAQLDNVTKTTGHPCLMLLKKAILKSSSIS